MTPTTGTFLWETNHYTPMTTGTIMLFGVNQATVPDTQYVTEDEYRTFLGTKLAFQPTGTINNSVLTGTFNIQFLMGNGSSVVPTGAIVGGYHYVEVPYACQIESWSLLADATGSITVNLLKSTYAGFPPTSPLAGLGQPKMTNLRKTSGTPTGTVTLAIQDLLLVEVVSSATVKIADLSLRGRKL